MRGQIEHLLDQGIEAARAGEIKRAREILIRVIQLDQRNETAWLWLGDVVEAPGDRVVCLENVLIINPNNEYALKTLRHLRQRVDDETIQASLLPRLTKSPQWFDLEWGVPGAEIFPPPTERLCPRCDFRNPGWAYVCDRCGADLQPVDLYKAVGPASKPRQPNAISLLEACGALFVFDQLWAFLPEIELASWGRSLAALVMAALFTSAWRALTSIVLQLLVSKCDPRSQLVGGAVFCAVETVLLTLRLTLACLPLVLLTWIGARMVGGHQGFKIHAHLTTVAFSAWVVLGALLAPLITCVPYLWGDTGRFALLSEGMPVFVGTVVGVVGAIWLTQALRIAHRLSAARAVLVTLLVVMLGAALFLGLNLLTGGLFAELVGALAFFLLPLPD